MNVLILNDTKESINPGCKATTNGLINLIKDEYEPNNIFSLPVKYGYNYFRYCYGLGTTFLLGKNKYFDKIYRGIKKIFYGRYDKNINFNEWKDSARKMYEEDLKFSTLLDSSDLVVINMEGTIHHNKIGALTLLGMAYVAKKICDKKVYLVNGTIQDIDKKLLDSIIPYVDKISVRESLSYKWLKEKGYNVVQAADCAFLNEIWNDNYLRVSNDSQKPKCLYTPGVLAGTSNIKSSRIINHLDQLKKAGYFTVFYVINYNENMINIISEVKKMNIAVVFAEQIDWSSIGSYIKEFDLVISGRYHIFIFALMSQVPAIIMESNSWKMKGLIDLLELETDIITDQNIMLDNPVNKVLDLKKIKNLAKKNI